MKKSYRVWAVIGLVLICVSIVCMLVGMFAGAAKALLLNISLSTFVAAAAVLVFLAALRKRDAQQAEQENDQGE